MKGSFSCNSLKWKHYFQFLFSFKRRKGRSLFKNAIASFFSIDSNRVFLYGSARMSIYSIIKAMDWKKEDEIIVVGYTCVVVTNAISYTGLKAVYIDINEDTLNVNTPDIHELINERTKAIIVSHNFGIVYDDIPKIKSQYPDLMVIEDAAHTFGSKDKAGAHAGLIGDAAYFSLEYSKAFTTGMGGILVVNNENLRSRVEKLYNDLPSYPSSSNIKILLTLKTHLLTSKRFTIKLKWKLMRILSIFKLRFQSEKAELEGKMPKHYPVKLGKNLSYLGYLQCREITAINEVKAKIAEAYHDTFTNIPSIKQYYHLDYNYVRYPILFDKAVSAATINAIKKDLKSIGIMTGEWFNDVIHPKGSFRYCYNEGDCPVGESVSKRIINFPVNIHSNMKKDDFEKIRGVLLEHL